MMTIPNILHRAFLRFNIPVAFLIMVSASPGAGVPDQRPQPYSVEHISPLLLLEPSSVVRIHSRRFRVIDHRRAVVEVTSAVTVFKREDREKTDLLLYYNRFVRITKLEGALYDSKGEKFRSLGDDDIGDYSAVSDYALFEDTRAKVATMYHDVYPYTIEYVYEETYDGYINWPVWVAQESEAAVEVSEFEVKIPMNDSLRFWCNVDTVKPAIGTDRGLKTYRWAARMLPKLSKSEMEEDLERRTVVVRISPGIFEIDRYAGDLSSWESFGDWYAQLTRGKDILPPDAVEAVGVITRNAADVRERIARLYKYMQSRTRYVSIKLGIGGWEPFDATYVHNRGYGDCKALSNYMVSILQQAGIAAYPALISNGTSASSFVANFPSNQFNHCIVSVPVDRDTLWLECTDPYSPAGYIGKDNEGRFALMITPDGGRMVRTPVSSSRENFQFHEAIVDIDGGGNAVAALLSAWGGNQRDRVRSGLITATPEKRERWLLNSLQLSGTEILDYRLQGMEADSEKTMIHLKFSVKQYGSASGNRIFFEPNMLEKRTYVPPENAARRSPVNLVYPYHDVDTIVYRFSPLFKCEALPAEVSISSSFGSFHSRMRQIDETTLSYVRSLEIRASSVVSEKYQEYRNFFSQIAKSDKKQVVLLRKD